MGAPVLSRLARLRGPEVLVPAALVVIPTTHCGSSLTWRRDTADADPG